MGVINVCLTFNLYCGPVATCTAECGVLTASNMSYTVIKLSFTAGATVILQSREKHYQNDFLLVNFLLTVTS
jgi:hypothetical protein